MAEDGGLDDDRPVRTSVSLNALFLVRSVLVFVLVARCLTRGGHRGYCFVLWRECLGGVV